jgi:hypothetical protein
VPPDPPHGPVFPRRRLKIDGHRGDVLEERKPEGGRLRTYALYGADNKGSDPVASLVASEQSDGSWEVSFLKPDPSDETVAERLFEAVERDLGADLSPNGVLTERAYRRWHAQEPGRVAGHVELRGPWAGLWASPKAGGRPHAFAMASVASPRDDSRDRDIEDLYAGGRPVLSIAGLQGYRPAVEPLWSHAGNVDRRKRRSRKAAASTDAPQSVYLSASGSLIQFNVIVAAIQGLLLSFNVDAPLRSAAAAAVSLHVLAVFILCWAARPIVEPPSTVRSPSFADDHRHAPTTFRNYRRGWRLTLLALTASSLAAAMFVLSSFGVTASDVASGWLAAIQSR